MKYRFLLTLITLFITLPAFAGNTYKSPCDLCVTKDGKILYVVNSDAREIAVINTAENIIFKTLSLGDFAPTDAALSNDEKTLYVTGGGVKGQVFAVDTEAGTIAKKAVAGHSPRGAVLSPDGTKLFVCNQFTNDVGEYRLPDLQLARTFKVVREPRDGVVTKDGKYLLVANSLPYAVTNNPEDLSAVIHVSAEISIINLASGETKSLVLPPNGSGSLSGICMSPDGRYVYVTNIIARFLMPTTQVERGWMNTAGIAIIDTTQLDNEKKGFVNSVLLDDVDQGAANPWGITTSPDGKKIYAAISGTSEVIVIDAVKMHEKLDARAEAEKKAKEANKPFTALATEDDFAFLVGLKTRIKLPGQGARAIIAADNNIYVGMYFSDTVQKIDATSLKPTEIALGPTPVWTAERRGEIHWNDATLCLQKWQSCASCHPDARMDAYNWDLLNDGMGNSKNSKSLLLTYKTPPSMIRGVRDNPATGWNTETMGIQCVRTGFQFIHFTMPNETICKEVDAYLWAEKPIPSPFLVDGKLSAKAERGKKIFEDPKIGCASCHPAPLFTDQKMHDVGTKVYYNDTSEFDTPTLIELWRTAPYLHEGRYLTLQDLFKIGLHGDDTGDVAGLSDTQIDDLVEYIQSL